jgi:alcohol dehydrogenase
MDCAKLISAKTSNPSKDTKYFMQTLGLYPFATLPPFIAVPTTAGTGSETTIAAIISFPQEQRKYSMIDPSLCPTVAVMDPTLLVGLPKFITAPTGMDALTHAVESYLSPWRTEFTGKYSLDAVALIFKSLKRSFDHGGDLEARNEMLKASFFAGVAFTRANVGYVHAIAHQMGALYHTPHGEANGVILPHLLDFYLDTCQADLATLGVAAGVGARGEPQAELAAKFVHAVKQLGEDLDMPKRIKHFPVSDIGVVTTRARNEAHGDTFSVWENPIKYALDTGYPLPKFMSEEECHGILAKLVDPAAKPHAKL